MEYTRKYHESKIFKRLKYVYIRFICSVPILNPHLYGQADGQADKSAVEPFFSRVFCRCRSLKLPESPMKQTTDRAQMEPRKFKWKTLRTIDNSRCILFSEKKSSNLSIIIKMQTTNFI